jgi:tetratricopeptide (TPR) repeat protein
MKKIALLVVFTSMAILHVGCQQKQLYEQYKSPDLFEQITPSAQNEIALAESVSSKRLEYRGELEKIKSYYEQSGNQLKIEWVNRELKFIDNAPRYHYIIEAEVAGSDLRARDIIPKADAIYRNAVHRYETSCILPLPGTPILTGKTLISRTRMQIALNWFNQIIQDYPTSDKIDDCAFYAGQIHEFFEDYSIAVLYYKRAFQWDSATPYPARYYAARLLDYKLAERDQALELYRESLDREEAYHNANGTIESRINQLTSSTSNANIDDPNKLPVVQ